LSRSKLELYVDILEVMVVHGPLKVTWITLRARVNYALLKPILSSLMEKALVEEKKVKHGIVVFAATDLGRRSLEQYRQFSKSPRIVTVEKAQSIPALLLSP